MNTKQQQFLEAWQHFLNTPISSYLQQASLVNPETAIIELFHQVANTVPAYQAFLAEAGIDPSSIKTFADFQSLPLINKANYLQKYPLSQLCRGKLESCDMIAVSSGSTGKPTFWPRFITDELQIATRFEQIFYDSFHADSKSTLAVVCFALGTWVGGMYTASCCRHLAAKGYPITVVTPGNNKNEIFRVIQELASGFDQVVLLGYPPFLKDVIDTGISQGIEWVRYDVKLVMAGEVFSEEWRNLVCDRLGSSNPILTCASLYGTADAGVLGNETPLSICIRRFLANNLEAARSLFGESRLPTLVQYDPLSRFFEVTEDTLLFSGDNGIPLIRYHISDKGGIIPYQTMLNFLSDWGFNPLTELQSRELYSLPFVYVFSRSHFVISYFGANIYPENIALALEQPIINEWVTGKFVMQSKEDYDKNSFLSIVVELAPNVNPSLEIEQKIQSEILTQLLRLNSEFANYVPQESQLAEITLLPLGDPEYFPIGVKHRYSR